MISSCIRHPNSNKKSSKYFIKIYDWQLKFCSQKVEEDDPKKQTKARELRCALLLSVFEYKHNYLMQGFNQSRIEELGYCFFMSNRDLERETMGRVCNNRVINDAEYLQKLKAITIFPAFDNSKNNKTGYVFHPEIVQKFIDFEIENDENNIKLKSTTATQVAPGATRGATQVAQMGKKCYTGSTCATQVADNITIKNTYKNTISKNIFQSAKADCISQNNCVDALSVPAGYPEGWRAGSIKDDVARSIELAFLKTDYAAYMSGNIVHLRASCKRIATWCKSVQNQIPPIEIAALIFSSFKELHSTSDFWSSQVFTPTTLANQACLGQCYQKIKLTFVKKTDDEEKYQRVLKIWEDKYNSCADPEKKKWYFERKDIDIKNMLEAKE